jgi:hypothetical protein
MRIGINRRKVTVVASQCQRQRRFASIPVGGSRNEGATLKRSASHLDEQDDFKVEWLYNTVSHWRCKNVAMRFQQNRVFARWFFALESGFGIRHSISMAEKHLK